MSQTPKTYDKMEEKTTGESCTTYIPDQTGKVSVPGPILKGRRITLFLMCMTCLWGGSVFSIMSPFMPQEAKMKELSSFQTGVIFGCYQFGLLILSPFLGNYLTLLGSKRALILGGVLTGVFTILSGFTKFFPDRFPFFAAIAACRIVDAAGSACASIASYAIAANAFPDHMSLAFGLMHMAGNTGRVMSSAVGGFLYEIGGFMLPFIVMGGLMIVHDAILIIFLPQVQDIQRDKGTYFYSLLNSGLVWVTSLCIFNSAVGTTFMIPTLALHLKQLGLSPTLIGLTFAIMPATSGISAPIWGYISDKKNMHIPLLVFGNALAAFSVLLVGPSPVLSFLPSKMSVIATGLLALGLFNNCALIPARKCLLIGALEMGFQENIDTHGLVSGAFNTAFFLGAFVGPILSGFLYGMFGFCKITTVFSGFFFVSFLVSGVYFLLLFCRSRYKSIKSKIDQCSDLTEPKRTFDLAGKH